MIAQEMEANAKAVEILVRVQGIGETEALTKMLDLLRYAHQTGARGLGHATPCVEIRDLLGRFPDWRPAITPEPGFTSCLPTR